MSTTPSITKTGCWSAEIIFSAERAAAFRELMGHVFGRDCVCERGKHCPLMDDALLAIERTAS